MVKIVRLEQLNRIGKFMRLSMSKGEVREKLMSYHSINVKNYYMHKNIKYRGAIYKTEDFVFSSLPLVSSVQAVADLETLRYNCIGLADEEAWKALQDMDELIEHFKTDYDFEHMKKYKEFVLY